MPAFVRAQASFRELKAQERLVRTALVLEAYKHETGHIPERLEALSTGDLHGVSVATSEHGYRFSFHTKDGTYAYTATPEKESAARRSFCVDGAGESVATPDGAEPRLENGRCLAAAEQRTP